MGEQQETNNNIRKNNNINSSSGSDAVMSCYYCNSAEDLPVQPCTTSFVRR